jgi:hypothetical protein
MGNAPFQNGKWFLKTLLIVDECKKKEVLIINKVVSFLSKIFHVIGYVREHRWWGNCSRQAADLNDSGGITMLRTVSVLPL